MNPVPRPSDPVPLLLIISGILIPLAIVAAVVGYADANPGRRELARREAHRAVIRDAGESDAIRLRETMILESLFRIEQKLGTLPR